MCCIDVRDVHDIDFSQGLVVAAVVILISVVNRVDSSPHNRECDNESRVKLSILEKVTC